MRSIADMAGVNVSTVSRVLRQRPAKRPDLAQPLGRLLADWSLGADQPNG